MVNRLSMYNGDWSSCAGGGGRCFVFFSFAFILSSSVGNNDHRVVQCRWQQWLVFAADGQWFMHRRVWVPVMSSSCWVLTRATTDSSWLLLTWSLVASVAIVTSDEWRRSVLYSLGHIVNHAGWVKVWRVQRAHRVKQSKLRNETRVVMLAVATNKCRFVHTTSLDGLSWYTLCGEL